MKNLSKWGVRILPHVGLAVVVYAFFVYRDFDTTDGLTPIFAALGVVAVVCLKAMWNGDLVRVAASASALSVVLAVLCFFHGADWFTCIFGFFALSTMYLAKKIER
ncbi:MAG: hypothetical protein WCV89_00950 [Candidatus Paceibacterota bacterium]